MNVDWTNAIKAENLVHEICTQQEIDGFNFATEKAKGYVEFLDSERERLYNNIRPQLSLEIENKGPVNRPFKKDGSYSKMVYDWFEKTGQEWDVCGVFTRINWLEPDLGSRQKLMKQLSRRGWKPKEYTPKGNPRLTEDSMSSLKGGVGKDIALWYVLSHRRSQLQGWIDNVRDDGRITPGIIPLSTNTNRASHILVANLPKPNHDDDGKVVWYPDGKVVFGSEMRSVFIPDEGDILVGGDASGLELRCLAHRMNDSNFTKELLEGDIHTEMWNMTKDVGVETRSIQKNVTYSMIFGASDRKIGETAGAVGDRRQREVGRVIRERLMKGLPALDRLIKQVQKASERGFLIGLDGRKIHMRRDDSGKVMKHKALNTLLQSDGAIIMRYGMIYKEKWKKQKKIPSKQVFWAHDEWQESCQPDYADRMGEVICEAIRQTGRYFDLNCPLDAEYKKGMSYAETH